MSKPFRFVFAVVIALSNVAAWADSKSNCSELTNEMMGTPMTCSNAVEPSLQYVVRIRVLQFGHVNESCFKQVATEIVEASYLRDTDPTQVVMVWKSELKEGQYKLGEYKTDPVNPSMVEFDFIDFKDGLTLRCKLPYPGAVSVSN